MPKHKGLTMFFLDMKSPGVEVKPIKQANGQSDFNEVYFTDVRIPDSQRLGAVGDGWNVSLTTLMNERMSIGAGVATGFPELFEFCNSLMLDDGPAIEDRSVRSKLANWAVQRERAEIHQHARDLGAVEGRAAGTGEFDRQAGGGLDDAGRRDLRARPAGRGRRAERRRTMPKPPANSRRCCCARPRTRVEGGTDEILRNIIAERVLGLPGDIRVDKDVPFNKIPTKGRDRLTSSRTRCSAQR